MSDCNTLSFWKGKITTLKGIYKEDRAVYEYIAANPTIPQHLKDNILRMYGKVLRITKYNLNVARKRVKDIERTVLRERTIL